MTQRRRNILIDDASIALHMLLLIILIHQQMRSTNPIKQLTVDSPELQPFIRDYLKTYDLRYFLVDSQSTVVFHKELDFVLLCRWAFVYTLGRIFQAPTCGCLRVLLRI